MIGAGVGSLLGEVLGSIRSVVAEALRAGRLSEAQAREIAEVASEVPDAQEQLVEAAGKLTLQGLREESSTCWPRRSSTRTIGTAGSTGPAVSAPG